MVALDPVSLTGAPQQVDLQIDDGCCACIANESGYALRIRIGPGERWLGAWIADLYDIPPGIGSIQLIPVAIGSLVNAPSQSALISIAEPGESFPGVYPMALTRQASIAAGTVLTPFPPPPNPVVLETGAGIPIGDPGVSLAPDSNTESFTSAAAIVAGILLVGSFRPAAGQIIAPVGVPGPLTVAVGVNISPTYGQPTTAGDLLVAIVANAGTPATSGAGGWIQAFVVAGSGGPGTSSVAIWIKPNCGAAEAPPVFLTGLSGGSAQLTEWANAALAGVPDQTGNVAIGNVPSVTGVCGSVDTQPGDLIVSLSRLRLSGPASIMFADQLNNGATIIATADDGGNVQGGHIRAVYGLNPPVAAGGPVGTRPWTYDATGVSAPATGSTASVTLAAVTGKRYKLTSIAASIEQTAATASGVDFIVQDGATTIYEMVLGVAAAAGNSRGEHETGMARPGSVGASMTAAFTANVAGLNERINIGAYLS